MSVTVNPPPQLRIPKQFFNDAETRAFFEQQRTILFQLWTRTGGSIDLIAGQDIILVNADDDITVEKVNTLVIVDASNNVVNVTLPEITDDNTGGTVEVLAINADNNINVLTQGESIMDDTSVIINQQYMSLPFAAVDSDNWYIT